MERGNYRLWKHFGAKRSVAILIVTLVVVGGMISRSTLQPASAQQPSSITIQVEGEAIDLELGKNVHPQTYDLLTRKPEFAALEHIRWVFVDDMWVPLAKTGSPPSKEEPKAEPLVEPMYIPECRITLNVPIRGQCTSPWGSDRLFNNPNCPTMCTAGCAITSVSMVFEYYGASKNPRQFNECLGLNGCGNNCGLIWGCDANNCSENRARWAGLYPFYAGGLCSLLQQDVPPIVDVCGHFVVVYRSLGNNPNDISDYYINDPVDGSSYKRLSYYQYHCNINEYRRR